ncbi:hypothetical protein ES708_24102 [subsurface metagenome]
MKLIIVPVVAILAIAGLEIYAISQGVNGTLMSLAFAAIAGLGGYEIKVLRDRVKKVK